MSPRPPTQGVDPGMSRRYCCAAGADRARPHRDRRADQYRSGAVTIRARDPWREALAQAPWHALGAKVDATAIGQDMNIRVQLLGDHAIVHCRRHTIRTPVHGEALNRMRDERFAVRLVGCPTCDNSPGHWDPCIENTNRCSTRTGYSRSTGRRALVEPCLCAFLAQVVNVDLSQHAQHREHQLAPRRGQI